MRTTSNLIVSLLTIAALANEAIGQNYTWSPMFSFVSPPHTNLARMASDTARDRIVLFHGIGTQTWEWDGVTWAQQFPATVPPARDAQAMAFDEARQRVVMFGGGYTSMLNDTWEWDGADWVNVTPAMGPSVRNFHAMAYDSARQRVVMFGGTDGSSTSTFGDTWEWDGSVWTLLSPTFSPPPRKDHAMAYDELRGKIVLFGGADSANTHLADTWEWDGVNWLPIFTTTYPVARRGHAMAFDVLRQRVLMFAGHNGSYRGDTWEWDGLAWSHLQPLARPTDRRGHAMAFDSSLGRVVLFGGHSLQVGNNDDTWISGVPPVVASATTFGTGCGNPPLVITPDATGRPIIGQTATATITNAPTTFGAVAIGWSNSSYGPFALPVPLNSIGMTNCMLWQSSDVLGLAVNSGGPGTMTFALPIPNQFNILGVHAYLQAYVLAPGANALDLIASNGADWTFGDI